MFAIIRQRCSRNGVATRQMSKVWSYVRTGCGAVYCMTHHASRREKYLLAFLLSRTGRRDGGLNLVSSPGVKLLARFCKNPEGHVSMLVPTKFRALPAIDARLVGLQPDS